MNNKPLLQSDALVHVYQEEKYPVPVLTGADFQLYTGEMLAIVGHSGSGKSTLLHLLGTLEQIQKGAVYFQGENTSQWTEQQASQFRNQNLGFIYQFHHLLGEFSALENIAMPLLIAGISKKSALATAKTFLEHVGLSERGEHRPSALSGGERQRVAIARALVNNPKLVLADEPTGNLDRHTTQDIYQLLRDLNQRLGTAFIVVTHSLELARLCDRTLVLTDGKLLEA